MLFVYVCSHQTSRYPRNKLSYTTWTTQHNRWIQKCMLYGIGQWATTSSYIYIRIILYITSLLDSLGTVSTAPPAEASNGLPSTAGNDMYTYTVVALCNSMKVWLSYTSLPHWNSVNECILCGNWWITRPLRLPVIFLQDDWEEIIGSRGKSHWPLLTLWYIATSGTIPNCCTAARCFVV